MTDFQVVLLVAVITAGLSGLTLLGVIHVYLTVERIENNLRPAIVLKLEEDEIKSERRDLAGAAKLRIFEPDGSNT